MTIMTIRVQELLWRHIDMRYFAKVRQRLCSIAFILLLLGCSTVTPHENFKNHIYGEIGESISKAPDYSWRNEKKVVKSKLLPNGNIENEYKYRGSCQYFFEINPKTGIIASARFEGQESDCVVVP